MAKRATPSKITGLPGTKKCLEILEGWTVKSKTFFLSSHSIGMWLILAFCSEKQDSNNHRKVRNSEAFHQELHQCYRRVEMYLVTIVTVNLISITVELEKT